MDDKIRVMFMQSQTFFGSDSRVQSLLVRNLDRRQFEVHVACNLGSVGERSPALQALEQIPNVYLRPTHFGPSVKAQTKATIAKATVKGSAPMLVSLAHLARYMRRQRIDIVHGTEKPRDTLYGLVLARLSGAKLLVHVHVKAGVWQNPLTRFAMSRADGLMGVSAYVEDALHLAGYDPRRTFHVVNSLDAGGWDPRTDGSAVRKEFGIADDVPVMAIVARIYPWKGHAELLKALATVKQQTTNWRLLLVGEDDPRATLGGGSFTPELNALIEQFALHEHVIFTGLRHDIPQILAAADIYTMPSYEEPCAIAYLEAMAMEKPIIALNGGLQGGGGTREMVDHGKAGLLSTAYDIDELAANILTLLQNPQLRRRMGQYARARVLDYYNPHRIAAETANVYRKMLGRPPQTVQTARLPVRSAAGPFSDLVRLAGEA